MKFSKDKKKRKIERRLWNLCIEIAKLRAGNDYCELPGCNNKADQTDHCFSASKCVRLRFEPRNLTRLCRGCHWKKSYEVEGFEKRVDAHVRLREGEGFWKYLMQNAKGDGFKWDILSLEEQEKILIEQLEYAKKRCA